MNAKSIMNTEPFIVSPEMKVNELAQQLLDKKLDGACVVEKGRLVGVVTSMDLVFQEKNLHLPTFVTILDAVFPLGSQARVREELEKMTGAVVRDIMSRDPISVAPSTKLDEMATLMVEKHITILPVVESGQLIGTVRKPEILLAAFRRPRKKE